MLMKKLLFITLCILQFCDIKAQVLIREQNPAGLSNGISASFRRNDGRISTVSHLQNDINNTSVVNIYTVDQDNLNTTLKSYTLPKCNLNSFYFNDGRMVVWKRFDNIQDRSYYSILDFYGNHQRSDSISQQVDMISVNRYGNEYLIEFQQTGYGSGYNYGLLYLNSNGTINKTITTPGKLVQIRNNDFYFSKDSVDNPNSWFPTYYRTYYKTDSEGIILNTLQITGKPTDGEAFFTSTDILTQDQSTMFSLQTGSILPYTYIEKNTNRNILSLINFNDLSVTKQRSYEAADNFFISKFGYHDESSGYFVFIGDTFDSTIIKRVECLDSNLNLKWSFQFPQNFNYSSIYTFNYAIDNNTALIHGMLIQNGNLIWDRSRELMDSLPYYNGTSWQNLPPSMQFTSFSNGKLFFSIHYIDNSDFDPFINRTLLIDPGNGNIITDIRRNNMVSCNSLFTLNNQILLVDNKRFGNLWGIYTLNSSLYSLNANFIKGIAYLDANNNNTYNNGEAIYYNGYITAQKNTEAVTQHLANNTIYNLSIDTGTYTTKLQLYHNYYTTTPAQFVRTHATYGNIDTLLFALHPIPGIHDVQVDLINNWFTRMGQQNSYSATIKNMGTSVANGKLKLVLDHRLLNVSSTPPFNNRNGDTLSWNVVNVQPNASATVTITFTGTTPPDLNAGDTLFSRLYYESDSIDVTPIDNSSSVSEIIRASYDPNEKSILSGEKLTPAQVANGNYISYIVHFQNTGNDTAFTVVVLDTLSPNVDMSSLQVTRASHPYTLDIINGHILKFTFRNIRLSYNTNNTSSTGYVAYKIKPLSSLSAGSVVNNTAQIFFDYNQPISTSTVQTQIYLISAIQHQHSQSGNLQLYPNPNNGIFSLNYENKGAANLYLQVLDVSGKTVLEKQVAHQDKSEIKLNLSGLQKGIYWIKLTDRNEFYTKAVIIQ